MFGIQRNFWNPKELEWSPRRMFLGGNSGVRSHLGGFNGRFATDSTRNHQKNKSLKSPCRNIEWRPHEKNHQKINITISGKSTINAPFCIGVLVYQRVKSHEYHIIGCVSIHILLYMTYVLSVYTLSIPYRYHIWHIFYIYTIHSINIHVYIYIYIIIYHICIYITNILGIFGQDVNPSPQPDPRAWRDALRALQQVL